MEERGFSAPLAAVRAFLSAAEFKNLTRTAEVLGMSQPSLSRILASLEKELGVALFVRSRRGVQLTEAGARFRARASGIVRQMDGLVSELRTREVSPTGRVAVGLPVVMTELMSAPLASWFTREMPRARLSVHEGISDEMEFELSLGRLDLALLISTDTRSRNLEIDPIASEQVYLHGPKGSGYDAKRAVGWNALSDTPLILPRQSNFLRRKIEEASKRHGFVLDVIMEINTPSLILSLVERGIGFTVLPGCASHRQRESGRVVASPLRDLKVVWTLAKSKTPAQPALVAAVERKIRQLVAEQAKRGLWRFVG
jgi:LysR family transcriptional regulator, nitrogen assimilation regulatory protein